MAVVHAKELTTHSMCREKSFTSGGIFGLLGIETVILIE